jgi:SWI/SNF-related matrix-associated actin-dependent regulator 1 of chromatin subfamily A
LFEVFVVDVATYKFGHHQRNALEQLRFQKFKKQRTTLPTLPVASSSSSPDPTIPPVNIPPPQSRDGTVPSRYFSSTYTETILVPDSSPLQVDQTTHSRGSHLHANDNDVASFSRLKIAEFRPFSIRAGGHDPLSAPSGFVTRHDVSFTNMRAGNDKAGSNLQIAGERASSPPLSRSGSDPLDLFNQQDSPGSPGIHRARQRKRVASDFTTLSNTSEESLPEVGQAFAGSSKPRIIRGNRPSSNEASPGNLSSSEAEDPRFIRFKVTMPQHRLSTIRAAWKQAKGDVKEATQLLSQPGWNPNPPSVAQPATESTGRVKELEEASRALRAAMKEKGKKSLIYANRGHLEVTTASPSSPPPSKAPVDPVESPIVAPSGRRRVRKLADSDSDSEQVEREPSPSHSPSIGRHRPSYQTQALNFFNTKNSEALQELTGTFYPLTMMPISYFVYSQAALQNKRR